MEDHEKQLSRLNRIYDEYKYREDTLKGNFTNLYMSLSISIAFFGTIIVFLSKNTEVNTFELYCFLFLLLPVFTYIFGLLYCYNIFAITKGAAVLIKLEKNIVELQKKLYKETDYIGWGIAEKKKNIGRVLVYGTILMFYVLFPLLSIIWGIIIAKANTVNLIFICCLALSIIFYVIYIIFIVIILSETKNFYNNFQAGHNYKAP